MARDKVSSKKTSNPPPKKTLAIAKGQIQKNKAKAKTADKGKGKKASTTETVLIHYVRMYQDGRVYGYTSLDEDTHYIMYPPSGRSDQFHPTFDLETPPSSPDRGNVFTDDKPYPFGVLETFLTPKSEDRYDYFNDIHRKPVPTLYPHMETLERLGMDIEVGGLMRVSGLHMLFREDPGTYSDVVTEFVSSFETVEVKSVLTGWRFAMGGKLWDVATDVLRDWFRFPQRGVFSYSPSMERVAQMWLDLTGRDYTEKYHHSSRIKDHTWWVIHKFIAGCFFVREDKGRFAQKLELAIMSDMRAGRTVDWLEALTKGLLDNQDMERLDKAMGGGSFVTKLALKLRFVLREGRPVRSALTIPAMVQRQMIKADLTWRNDTDSTQPPPDDSAPADPSSVPSTSAPATDIPGPSAPSLMCLSPRHVLQLLLHLRSRPSAYYED